MAAYVAWLWLIRALVLWLRVQPTICCMVRWLHGLGSAFHFFIVWVAHSTSCGPPHTCHCGVREGALPHHIHTGAIMYLLSLVQPTQHRSGVQCVSRCMDSNTCARRCCIVATCCCSSHTCVWLGVVCMRCACWHASHSFYVCENQRQHTSALNELCLWCSTRLGWANVAQCCCVPSSTMHVCSAGA